MKASWEFISTLNDIHFKYERMEALVSVLQQYISECVEVAGAPDNAVEYSLYEIELGIGEANEQLKALIDDSKVLKEDVA